MYPNFQGHLLPQGACRGWGWGDDHGCTSLGSQGLSWSQSAVFFLTYIGYHTRLSSLKSNLKFSTMIHLKKKINLLWLKRQEGSTFVEKLSEFPLLSRALLLSPTRAGQPSVTEAAPSLRLAGGCFQSGGCLPSCPPVYVASLSTYLSSHLPTSPFIHGPTMNFLLSNISDVTGPASEDIGLISCTGNASIEPVQVCEGL